MDWWILTLGSLLLLAVVWRLRQLIDREEKKDRILTEGTVTSITTQVKHFPSLYALGPTSSYLEVEIGFWFYADGKRWTGRKTAQGPLTKKMEGDRIDVYYHPSEPGSLQWLEP